jgi:hypothetical protein
MAQPTITIKDGNGTAQTIFTQNPNGQSTAANSQPVVVASDSGVLTLDTVFWNESTTPLAANGTFTGTGRDINNPAITGMGVTGASSLWVYFNASFLANQTGIARIESSPDNATWSRETVDTALAISTPLKLSVKVMTKYYRVVLVNGATLQTSLVINSSFSSN